MRGILPIIPPRSNRKVPVHPDYRRYKDRNRIERMFGKLKQHTTWQWALADGNLMTFEPRLMPTG